MDEPRMAREVHQLRPKPAGDSEKIRATRDMSTSAISDLMVRRVLLQPDDFIRTRIATSSSATPMWERSLGPEKGASTSVCGIQPRRPRSGAFSCEGAAINK